MPTIEITVPNPTSARDAQRRMQALKEEGDRLLDEGNKLYPRTCEPDATESDRTRLAAIQRRIYACGAEIAFLLDFCKKQNWKPPRDRRKDSG